MHDADPAPVDGRPPAPEGPWREPVRGGHPDPVLLSAPGITFLRALVSGETPQPPLSHLTGMRLTEFAAGTATFTFPLSGWLCAADGRIALGPLTIPADAAMACAIISALPPATNLSTAELSLRQVRAARPGTTLQARARMLHPGPPVALAEVSLLDEDDRLIALGGSLCVVSPLGTVALGDGAVPGGAPEAATEGPDPWQRPLPEDGNDPSAGPLGRLTGLRRLDSAAGEAAFALPATRWLCAPPPGRAQGGTVAMLADAAITAAVRATVAARQPVRADRDQGQLSAAARQRRAGRVRDGHGDPCRTPDRGRERRGPRR